MLLVKNWPPKRSNIYGTKWSTRSTDEGSARDQTSFIRLVYSLVLLLRSMFFLFSSSRVCLWIRPSASYMQPMHQDGNYSYFVAIFWDKNLQFYVPT